MCALRDVPVETVRSTKNYRKPPGCEYESCQLPAKRHLSIIDRPFGNFCAAHTVEMKDTWTAFDAPYLDWRQDVQLGKREQFETLAVAA